MILKISGLFDTFKQLDEQLLRLFTFSPFYPTLEDRPQTWLAILATLFALNLSLVALILQNNWLLVLSGPLWLNAFYQWRLWIRRRG
ncbi:MAG: hypothetical protein AB1801_21350 [Chloroflexota bacterium]